MSYYRSASVSPSVIPKLENYYQSDEENDLVLSPSRRLGVFHRRTTPSIYDYSNRGRIDYDDEEEEETEDEGEYSRGTPLRSPRLYQPSRYVSRPRNDNYIPRRLQF